LIDLQNSFTDAKGTRFPTKPILGYLLVIEQRISDVCTSRLHFGPISGSMLLTLQLTIGESVCRHLSMQMVDMLNTFCEQTLANNLHFSVFLVQVASAHGVKFLLC